MALEDQLDPGYEQDVVRRAPDFTGGPLGAPYSLAEAERLRQLMPQQATRYVPRPTELAADAITRAQRGRRNVTPAQARQTAELLVGGSSSPLPFDLGLADLSLLAGSPKWAAEAGFSSGKAAATGEGYGGAALETALAALPIAPTLAKIPRAIGEYQPRGGMGSSQRGMFTMPTLEQKVEFEALESQGLSPQDLWQKTMVLRMPDGTLRTEFSDKEAIYRGGEAFAARRGKQEARMQGWQGAAMMRDILDKGGSIENAKRQFRIIYGQEPPAALVRSAETKPYDQLVNQAEIASEGYSAPLRGIPTTQVLEHPELYTREPQLKRMYTAFEDEKALGPAEAQYTAGNPGGIDLAMRYGMDPSAARKEQGRSAMLHEVQHSLQEKYGLAPGSNPDAIKEAYAKAGTPITNAEAYNLYQRSMGEVEARLTEERRALDEPQRRMAYPLGQTGQYDLASKYVGVPPERIVTDEKLMSASVPAYSMGGTQRGAIDAKTLGEALAGERSTLRSLEEPHLQGRTEIPKRDLWRALARPDVTQEEKDILRYAMRQEPGQTIPAEQLVQDVKAQTAPYELAPKEYFGEAQYADYGLKNIGRSAGEYSYDEMKSVGGNYQNARTTVHRSPTPTSPNNHFNDPNYFGHTRAFEADGIPHVVEIQSDLAQKAARDIPIEERQRLQANLTANIRPQLDVLNEIHESHPAAADAGPYVGMGAAGNVAWVKDSVNRLLENKDALLAANPDLLMIIETEFMKALPETVQTALVKPKLQEIEKRAAAGDAAAINDLEYYRAGYMDPASVYPEGELLRTVVNDPAIMASYRDEVTGALDRATNYQRQRVSVLASETQAKLNPKLEAEAQRPMFKNWERRLIREELTRAATPQVNPEWQQARRQIIDMLKDVKSKEDYFRSNGYSKEAISVIVKDERQQIEKETKNLQNIEQYLPTSPVVRFADADTVANVEGWPKTDYEYEIRNTENQIARWPETQRDHPLYQELLDRLAREKENFAKYGPGEHFEYPEHAGIHDRYKKEIANYLKSLGGKHVKDEMGHGWWEVPVDPKKHKRTPIFGMGGAVAAGAGAGYNAAQPED